MNMIQGKDLNTILPSSVLNPDVGSRDHVVPVSHFRRPLITERCRSTDVSSCFSDIEPIKRYVCLLP